MPFEGDVADYRRGTPAAAETSEQSVIRKARELISRRSFWSSRNYREGDAFCILGALRVAHHGDAWRPGTGGAQEHVMRVLRRRGYTGITTFNDQHASHGEILAVLDAAYDAAGKPKWCKLDLSRISPKGAARHFLTREPQPAPMFGALQPSLAEIIERVSAAYAPEQTEAAHAGEPARRAQRLRELGNAIDLALLEGMGIADAA